VPIGSPGSTEPAITAGAHSYSVCSSVPG
jgi:hypothetical protein